LINARNVNNADNTGIAGKANKSKIKTTYQKLKIKKKFCIPAFLALSALFAFNAQVTMVPGVSP
jgi:hypothetical protein